MIILILKYIYNKVNVLEIIVYDNKNWSQKNKRIVEKIYSFI